jgi:hypothetical protein
MRRIYKGLFLILIIFVFFSVIEVSAIDAYFVWEKTEIDVPLNDSLEKYKNQYEISFYVNGKKSTDFTVEKEVNCSTFTTVLTNKIGKYTVYYKAKSEKYHVSSTQAIIFNVIDVTKPKITQICDVELESGQGFKLEDFFNFSDDTTSLTELKVILDDSYVIYNMVGLYDAKLTVIDKFNNKTEKEFKIKITDKIKPQIIVLKSLVLSYGSLIDINEYFIATDDCNGDLTNLIVIEGFNPNKLGLQEIWVSVSDYSNNTTKMKVSVNVVDNEKPMLLLKHSEITIDINEYRFFNDEYFKKYIVDISDNHTSLNDLVLTIDYSNVTNDVGDFDIIYSLKDIAGNITTEKMIVKLREVTGPKLSGEDIVTIKLGEEIDLLSLIEVYDEYDINAEERLEILSSNFNNTIAGSYEVTYICYNNSGNFTTKVIIINVIDDKLDDVIESEKEEIENKNDDIIVGENNSKNNETFVEEPKGLDLLEEILNIDTDKSLKIMLVIIVVILFIVIFKKRN